MENSKYGCYLIREKGLGCDSSTKPTWFRGWLHVRFHVRYHVRFDSGCDSLYDTEP
jgi:hypothetical protein